MKLSVPQFVWCDYSQCPPPPQFYVFLHWIGGMSYHVSEVQWSNGGDDVIGLKSIILLLVRCYQHFACSGCIMCQHSHNIHIHLLQLQRNGCSPWGTLFLVWCMVAYERLSEASPCLATCQYSFISLLTCTSYTWWIGGMSYHLCMWVLFCSAILQFHL